MPGPTCGGKDGRRGTVRTARTPRPRGACRWRGRGGIFDGPGPSRRAGGFRRAPSPGPVWAAGRPRGPGASSEPDRSGAFSMHRFPVLSVLLVLAGCVGLDPSPGVPAARTSPSVAAPGVAADPGGGRWSRLEAAVRARIEEASPGEVAVVVLDLEDGGGLAVDG